MTVCVVFLDVLIIVLSGIIYNVGNNRGNIIIIGEGGGIICWSTDGIITIEKMLFNNVMVRIELIHVKDFFKYGVECIII